METTPKKLSLGPGRAVNHTSDSQAAGWRKEWTDALSTYNRSPLGQRVKVNPLDFGRKLTGMVTDHAPDQLKLARLLRDWKIECDREMRGYRCPDTVFWGLRFSPFAPFWSPKLLRLSATLRSHFATHFDTSTLSSSTSTILPTPSPASTRGRTLSYALRDLFD